MAASLWRFVAPTFGVLLVLGSGGRVAWAAGEYESVRDTIIAAHQKNRDRLKELGCCHLVWHRHTKEDNFIPGRVIETEGDYELWIKGEKIAFTNMEDKLDEKMTKRRDGQKGAYNGQDFRLVDNDPNRKLRVLAIATKPKFMQNENWLDTIGWRSPPPLEGARGFKHVKELTADFEEANGERLCRIDVVHTADGSQVQWFALDRGSCLVRDKTWNATGEQTIDGTYRVEKLGDRFWMPVEHTARSFSGGKETLVHHYVLDLKRSSVGDPSAVPDAVFEIAVTPDMQVRDRRGEQTIAYSGVSKPLEPAELQERIKQFASKGRSLLSPPRALWPALLVLGALLLVMGFLRRRKRARS